MIQEGGERAWKGDRLAGNGLPLLVSRMTAPSRIQASIYGGGGGWIGGVFERNKAGLAGSL